jgi:uncharacterized protein (TIGR02246 family)
MAGSTQDIDTLIDGWHQAASTADEVAYFGAMTDDAVFIGTDKTERWGRAAFEAFAKPHFAGDEAWTYTPTSRQVRVAGDVGWFDETLVHARYGDVRGSGVVLKQGKDWKLAHYVLSFPVPNDAAADVIDRIKRQAEVDRPQ